MDNNNDNNENKCSKIRNIKWELPHWIMYILIIIAILGLLNEFIKVYISGSLLRIILFCISLLISLFVTKKIYTFFAKQTYYEVMCTNSFTNHKWFPNLVKDNLL